MNKHSTVERISLWRQWTGWIGVFLVLETGCVAPRKTVEETRYTPVRIVHAPIELMRYPRDIKAEYRDPSFLARQIFSWDKYGGEWRIMVLQPTGLTAGYYFSKPVCLSEKLDQTSLNFRFIPIEAESRIQITLQDESGQFLKNLPLAGYRISTWRDWGRYAIPITHFLNDDEGLSITQAVFSGVQITAEQQDNKEPSLAVRDLQIGPLLWGIPGKEK